MSRRISFEAFVRRTCAAGQILLCPTGKPVFPSERGRGTRKENELNQIPHPYLLYHADLKHSIPAARIWFLGPRYLKKAGNYGVSNGIGLQVHQLLAWPASCQGQITKQLRAFFTGRDPDGDSCFAGPAGLVVE